MQKDSNLWKVLHEQLEEYDGDAYPMPKKPSSTTFKQCFNAKKPRIHIILDESDQLLALPNNTQRSFSTTIRAAKQLRKSSLGGLCLLGTWALKDMLRNRSWETSNLDSPFSVVS